MSYTYEVNIDYVIYTYKVNIDYVIYTYKVNTDYVIHLQGQYRLCRTHTRSI